MAKGPRTVAATSTLAMIRAAEARRVPTDDLLQQAGVSRALLEDPDTRLPGPTVLALWGALRARTGDPALQLSAPVALPFGAYRVIDYLVAASTTVGDGIRRFARFFELIADGVVLAVDGDEDEYWLDLSVADGTPVPPVYVDYVFAALVGRIRMRIRPDLRVHRVELQQPEPPNPAPYETVFGAPVCFGAEADRLYFTRQEWGARTVSGDEALAQLMEAHARTPAPRVVTPASTFRSEVERALVAGIPEGRSAADVAKALHVSVRTLQRKLAAAGTTFREVSEAVSAQIAVKHLANPRTSIDEVAFLLGFSDPSSFNRAFRRWTGEPPGRWRRARKG
jgi:AraC-like DNA-binding protein